MSLKGILGKEFLPAGDIMHPKASVLGILGLAVAVGVLIAGYKLGDMVLQKGVVSSVDCFQQRKTVQQT